MDIAKFLAGKSAGFMDRWLDLVEAKSQGDELAVERGIDLLLAPLAMDDPNLPEMRALYHYMIDGFANMRHIDELGTESYANYGPGSTHFDLEHPPQT